MTKNTQTIETSRLILRRFDKNDAEEMFNNYLSSDKVTKFLTFPTYKSVNEVENYLDFVINEYEKDRTYRWCIVLKQTNQVVGAIDAVSFNEDLNEATIGYCLGDKYWHKGIMSEAFSAVIKYLFEEENVNRIQATHDINNPNSGKVMQKCRLKFEGIHRQAGINNTGICDSAYYAILREDYVILNSNKKTDNLYRLT